MPEDANRRRTSVTNECNRPVVGIKRISFDAAR
jgi:hypothetical protein